MSTEEITKSYANISDWRFKVGLLTIRNHVKGRFYTTNENIYQFNLSIFLPKFSFLTEVINELILNCLASGLFERWDKISNPPRRHHQDDHYELKQLNVEHFIGCFYLCAGGITLALLAFFGEILYHKFDERKQKKKSRVEEECKRTKSNDE